jgi:hypothetical protein
LAIIKRELEKPKKIKEEKLWYQVILKN